MDGGNGEVMTREDGYEVVRDSRGRKSMRITVRMNRTRKFERGPGWIAASPVSKLSWADMLDARASRLPVPMLASWYGVGVQTMAAGLRRCDTWHERESQGLRAAVLFGLEALNRLTEAGEWLSKYRGEIGMKRRWVRLSEAERERRRRGMDRARAFKDAYREAGLKRAA